MKYLIVIIFVSLYSFGVSAENINVCLAPIAPATSGTRGLTSPTAQNISYSFEVQIGSKKYQQNSGSSQCGLFTKEKNILVVVRDAGSIKESFYISPKEYIGGACIWFKPLYSTWSVWKLKDSKYLCINRT